MDTLFPLALVFHLKNRSRVDNAMWQCKYRGMSYLAVFSKGGRCNSMARIGNGKHYVAMVNHV